jgi:hypothetical protein
MREQLMMTAGSKFSAHHQEKILYDVVWRLVSWCLRMLQQVSDWANLLSRKILHHLLCRNGLVLESK